MGFTPRFMESFEAFDRERRALRSAAQWRAFKERWFDCENWPEKPGAVFAREVTERPGEIAKIRDGRLWSPTFWTVGLTPEARYQYFWTLRAVGAPLEDPVSFGLRRTPGSGWQQECAFCGISTSDKGGDPTCPLCGRELYWYFVAD